MVALVLRADGEPLLVAFARRADMFRVANHHRLAGTADHREGVVGLDGFSLLDGRNRFRAIPEFRRRAGMGERSKRAERNGCEQDVSSVDFCFYDFLVYWRKKRGV